MTTADMQPEPLLKATVVTEHGASYYVQGAIRFQFFKEPDGGLSDTLKALRQLDEAASRTLTRQSGFEVPDAFKLEHFQSVLAGTVQSFWYLQVKDAISDNVQHHQNERIATYSLLLKKYKEDPDKFTKKVAARKGSPGQPRASKLYELDHAAAIDPEKFGKQAAVIITCMQKHKVPITVGDLAKLVEATKALTTKQPVERVVGFYLAKFKKEGLVYSEGSAPQESSAVKPANPGDPAKPAPSTKNPAQAAKKEPAKAVAPAAKK